MVPLPSSQDSLRSSSLANHYIFYYRVGDGGRGSDGGIGQKTVEHKRLAMQAERR